MTTATRSSSPTLGDALAGKLRKPRRREATHDASRPRRKRPASRPTQLEVEAQRILDAMEVAYVERRLGESHLGRELLRLSDARTKAKFREDFARLALHAAQQDADRCRKRHAEVCNQLRYAEYEKAHRVLWEAEALERKAKRLHAKAVTARELIDVELRLLAEAAR